MNCKTLNLDPENLQFGPAELAVLSTLRPEDDLVSHCDQKFKKTVSFDDTAHHIDEENIMSCVDFDNVITFYHVTPLHNRQISREQNCISRSCDKPSALPEAINITVLVTSSKQLIFF